MNDERIVKAFDKWMDDYVNDPAAFQSMTKSALDHLKARLEGKEPTYGQSSLVTLRAYYDAV